MSTYTAVIEVWMEIAKSVCVDVKYYYSAVDCVHMGYCHECFAVLLCVCV